MIQHNDNITFCRASLAMVPTMHVHSDPHQKIGFRGQLKPKEIFKEVTFVHTFKSKIYKYL